MKVQNFLPREGFLIVRKAVTDTQTDSGFEVEENSDDFLVYAQIIKSSADGYEDDDHVVFHVLDAQEFRDGSETYLLIKSDDIVGLYKL